MVIVNQKASEQAFAGHSLAKAETGLLCELPSTVAVCKPTTAEFDCNSVAIVLFG